MFDANTKSPCLMQSPGFILIIFSGNLPLLQDLEYTTILSGIDGHLPLFIMKFYMLPLVVLYNVYTVIKLVDVLASWYLFMQSCIL